MTSKIVGNHHITLSTGGAQEDWDFHTQTLGMRPVKKTMLYDGVRARLPSLLRERRHRRRARS